MVEEWNRTFIIAAYSVSWVVILGYLGRLVRKGSRARGDFDRIASQHGGESRQ